MNNKIILNYRNKWSWLMSNHSKNKNEYLHVTLAFDDWKNFSAHKGSSNPITMKNSFKVMYFRQQRNISYNQI